MFQFNQNYNSQLFQLNEKKWLKTFNQSKIELTDFKGLFNNWLIRLMNIYVNRIKWKNLPLEIEPWFIEKAILMNGVCCFFQDDITNDYAVTFCNLQGELNIYGIPQDWTAYSANGFQRNLNKNNAVLIYNNNDFIPDYNTLFIYAERLAYISVILMKNISLQKNSIAIATTKDTLLSAKNIVNKIDEGVDYIFVKDIYNIADSLKPINLQVEFKADKLRNEIEKEFNDFLNWCGIESFTSDKKERLVAGEASGNNGYVEIQRNISLNAREYACNKINAMFDLEVSAVFNSEIATLVNMGKDYVTEIIQKGEQINE